jgi:hypothetical protein
MLCVSNGWHRLTRYRKSSIEHRSGESTMARKQGSPPQGYIFSGSTQNTIIVLLFGDRKNTNYSQSFLCVEWESPHRVTVNKSTFCRSFVYVSSCSPNKQLLSYISLISLRTLSVSGLWWCDGKWISVRKTSHAQNFLTRMLLVLS